MVSKIMLGDKEAWKCSWCDGCFKPRHATRALYHLTKTPNGGIGICKGVIDPPFAARYKALLDKSQARKSARDKASASVDDYVEKRLAPMVTSLSSKKPRTAAPGGSAEAVTFQTSSTQKGLQPSISASLGKSSQSTITGSNHTALEMAIANFFHCENIPDSAVESPHFSHLLKCARAVGKDFKPPGRMKIGGELLDLNYKLTIDHIKTELLKEAPTFGIAWMSDGATIKRMPLCNVLAMTGGISPMTCAIVDATDQMKDGGKKDAVYVAHYMEQVINDFDPLKMHTDIFFFDGASNVQKGGQILEAAFPRAYCFHGGEHVVSLFFDDIAKLAPIKVSTS